jgi:hypothetical protein
VTIIDSAKKDAPKIISFYGIGLRYFFFYFLTISKIFQAESVIGKELDFNISTLFFKWSHGLTEVF